MLNITYTEEKEFNDSSLENLYNDADWTTYTNNLTELRNAIHNSLFVLTAKADNKLIGLIRVVGDGVTIIYIQDILVLQKYKRNKIGSNLIKKVIEKFENVRQKVLLTDDTKEARGFYESLGFDSCDKGKLVAFTKNTYQ